VRENNEIGLFTQKRSEQKKRRKEKGKKGRKKKQSTEKQMGEGQIYTCDGTVLLEESTTVTSRILTGNAT